MNNMISWLSQTLLVLCLVLLFGAPYLKSQINDMEHFNQKAIESTATIANGMQIRMNEQDEQIKQLRKAIENNYELTQAVLKEVLTQEKQK